MNKHPYTESFLRLSINRAIQPLRSIPSPTAITHRSPTITRPTSSSSKLTSLGFWAATATILCLSLLNNVPIFPMADAAPAKHTPAPNGLVNSMALTMSDTSAMPLQLQIEAQVAGIQKLAYLPTTGPAMDFYYLNYRPAYKAGESKIDFWMLTPQGMEPPKTGSLELMDEFGKVRLAVLVPEGTEIPRAVASKGEPFLWKSWQVPKELKGDFDFSEKFRVVLKTSSGQAVETMGQKKNKNEKRLEDPTLIDFLLVKNKNKHVNGAENANTVASSSASAVTVQDRQFRIKGLKANPGGKPNPAKVHVNRIAPVAVPATAASTPAKPAVDSTTPASKDTVADDKEHASVGGMTNKYNTNNKGAASSALSTMPLQHPAMTFMVLAVATLATYL